LDIEKELKKELEHLQTKYGECHEYTCEWHPCIKNERLPFNKNAELNGEVDKTNYKLMVYSCEYSEALRTLRHEFFEGILDKLVSPYVTLYNCLQRGFENSFMETTYHQKESIIEKLVKQEEFERGDKR